tara:strand:- start:728 stop:1861 length:1134 start_codon:yes stop_codon:yes gene_type:complete
MLNLSFCSSISSQIGLASVYASNLDDLSCIIIFPPFEYKDKDEVINIFANNKFKKIYIVKSTIVKIMIFAIIDFLKLLSYFNLINLNLISPRPNWLRSILGVNFFTKIFFKLSMNFKSKSYSEIFYGDGLSCFCYESKPFWLITKEMKKNSEIKISQKQKFYFNYHMFESENDFSNYTITRNIKFKKVANTQILNTLNNYSYFFTKIRSVETELERIVKLKNKFSKLKVFTTTTFSKTKRCSIEQEIKLYKSYFDYNIKSENCLLLFKFHPAAGHNINNKLSNYFKLKYKNNLIFDFDFVNSIPLEMILNLLISRNIFTQNEIDLFASSSGTAFPKSLFSDINLFISFGSKTINKFIKSEFIDNRLLQEKILKTKFL